MLALYRSGRQADALSTYQDGRRLLDDELGLEPSESIKRLQRAILAHDPGLEVSNVGPEVKEAATRQRSILVVPRALDGLDAVLPLAETLARSEPSRELVIVHVAPSDALGRATSMLHQHRIRLLSDGLVARAAAFSSPAPIDDLLRLESEHDFDLLVLDTQLPLEADITELLARASCDVALVVAAGGPPQSGPVVVPFGAAEHDWAALELGAWVARATGEPLRLIGAAWSIDGDERDASRLLADASLIVQRTAGVAAEPLLASPGRAGVMSLAQGAGLLVVGFTERWRQEGLGRVRSEIAASPPAPTVFVRRGLRPGGLAPNRARTRFTWSLTSAGVR